MKLLILVIGLVSVTCVQAGGYIAKGGVYDFKKPLDYYESAVVAGNLERTYLLIKNCNFKLPSNSKGKIAWSEKLENELALEGALEAERGAREAHYIPTFYTSQTNLEALVSLSRDAR